MSDMINRKIKSVLAIFVFICLGIFCLRNIYSFLSISKQKITSQEAKQSANVFSDIEDAFRENVAYRDKLVDFYGIYQKAIDHMVVGNFEFVADDDGVLHMINNYTPYQTENFIQEMKELKAYTEEKEVPLLYVQAPNREIANGDSSIAEFNLDDETMDTVVTALKDENIPVLDIREKLLEEDRNFELSDLFLHTDLHMQTDSEIWMADQVAKYLKDQMGLPINNMEYLEDMSLYTKKSYEMVGNYGRTYGKYFVNSDTFDIYHPNFDTSYEYYIPDIEGSNLTGSFDEVLMNGYENKSYDEYTYWVTDYMHFTVPYYTYINNNQENGKLLVITDSMAYRGLSYLSLTTKQITILDPRFFGEVDYVKLAMQEEYDAVIVLQGNYLIGVPLIIEK